MTPVNSLFSPITGLLLILAYGLGAFALTRLFTPKKINSKQDFLLANRNLGTWPAAFSIAATWIWAPALFLASEKAYTQGLAGVFWFIAPNVACLLLFAPFAARIRRLAPEGFTLSGYMRNRYSARVQIIYQIQLIGLAICSCGVQLLAGGAVIVFLTGLPFFPVTLLLMLIALSYSLFGGLRASVQTDLAQMTLILVVILLMVPWVLLKSGGLDVVTQGLGGITGQFSNLFSHESLGVAWSFGIPVTIGLLAGPFGDQSFYQRAFAIREDRIKPAFFSAALLFALVPLSLSLLGFVAAGQQWQISDTQMVNIATVSQLLPRWMMLPVALMLLSGLISTIDSNLCAVASIAGHDWTSLKGDKARTVLGRSRLSMILLCCAALVLANLPGMKILYLFLFYGTLRASTLLPTIMTLLRDNIPEPNVFFGILCAILIGLPLFAWGNFNGLVLWKVVGALLTVGISGAIVFAGIGVRR